MYKDTITVINIVIHEPCKGKREDATAERKMAVKFTHVALLLFPLDKTVSKQNETENVSYKREI